MNLPTLHDEPREDTRRPNGAFYVPERDGTILEYLSRQETDGHPRGFKTFAHFQMLIEAGVLDAELAEIGMYSFRIMYNSGRGDEHYALTSFEECEGVGLNRHGGKSGTHKVADILNGGDFEWWEISGINPRFLRTQS